jgi:hypothetical protein
LASVFDYAAASNCRAAVTLLLVCLLGFLPGIFQIPPVDREEAYFAQATKQMIETGEIRAEAIGLRYNPGPRIEAFNISIGRSITIAVFQSADAS